MGDTSPTQQRGSMAAAGTREGAGTYERGQDSRCSDTGLDERTGWRAGLYAHRRGVRGLCSQQGQREGLRHTAIPLHLQDHQGTVPRGLANGCHCRPREIGRQVGRWLVETVDRYHGLYANRCQCGRLCADAEGKVRTIPASGTWRSSPGCRRYERGPVYS